MGEVAFQIVDQVERGRGDACAPRTSFVHGRDHVRPANSDAPSRRSARAAPTGTASPATAR
jgi:hypothetical protein